MIELTGQDGQKIGINPAAIWHIRKGSGDQTAIYAVTGSAIFVLEPYPEVLTRCREQLGKDVGGCSSPRDATDLTNNEGNNDVEQHEQA